MKRFLISALIVIAVAGPAFADVSAIKETLERGDTKAAIQELMPLARGGDAEAQTLLGDLHMKGQGVQHSYALALSWYKRAASLGNPEAQFKVAEMYRQGIGAPSSIGDAVEWYEKAAEQDHVKAQSELGLIYLKGRGGIRRDEKKAKKWLGKAARQGDSTAGQALEAMKTERTASPSGILSPEKIIERFMEPLGEALGAALEEAMLASLQQIFPAGTEDAMERLSTMMKSGESYTFDPAGKAFFEEYIAAVNAKNIESLKKLIHPENLACMNDESRDFFAYMFDKEFEYEIPADYSLQGYVVSGDLALPFEDLISYPVRPTHSFMIDFMTVKNREPWYRFIFQHLVHEDGKWFLMWGCPTPEGLKMMAERGAAERGKE